MAARSRLEEWRRRAACSRLKAWRRRAVARATDRAADVTDYVPTRRWASPPGALTDCKGGV